MPNRKAIIQFINQMYNQHLDSGEFARRIQRLRKLGAMATDVLLDLIKAADMDKKQFLFGVLGEIGDRRVIGDLRDIISNPQQDDETKLLAAVVVSHLDDNFDVSLLERHLMDPQSLGGKVVENMLKKSDEPSFIKMFLENFPTIEREGQLAALEDLLAVERDCRLVNIVGPLSFIVDDELLQFIIPILVNSYDRRAFYYLQEIVKRSPAPEVQNMARQAIFKLGVNLQKGGLTAGTHYQFYQAYATTCDGSGSSIYIFAVKDRDQKIRLIDFVNNDLQGIKDAFGGCFSLDDFNKFIRRIKSEGAFLTIPVPPRFILDKVKLAEDLTAQSHRTLPLEYLALRDIFNDLDYEDLDFPKLQQAYEKFKREVGPKKQALLPQTKNLYNYDEVRRSWFIDYELMAFAIEEFIQIEQAAGDDLSFETINQIEDLYRRTARTLFKPEFLGLMVERLKDYSWLCFVGNKKERAKLAIVIMETLLTVPPEDHPFLKRMLEHSFEVHLYETDDDFYIEDNSFPDDQVTMPGWDESAAQEPGAGAEPIISRSSPSKFRELSQLTELAKLKFLAEQLPNSPFQAEFKPLLTSQDISFKIRQVNYLESLYDVFVSYHLGAFDWKAVRKELGICLPATSEIKVLHEVQQQFTANMARHGFDARAIETAERLWAEAIFLSRDELKPMSRPHSWSAGVELLVASLLFKPTPPAILERDYDINFSTIQKRMNQLVQILNLKVFSDPSYKYAFLDRKKMPF